MLPSYSFICGCVIRVYRHAGGWGRPFTHGQDPQVLSEESGAPFEATRFCRLDCYPATPLVDLEREEFPMWDKSVMARPRRPLEHEGDRVTLERRQRMLTAPWAICGWTAARIAARLYLCRSAFRQFDLEGGRYAKSGQNLWRSRNDPRARRVRAPVSPW